MACEIEMCVYTVDEQYAITKSIYTTSLLVL